MSSRNWGGRRRSRVAWGAIVGLWGLAAAADPWPGDAGSQIANEGDPGSLPSAYEPSGAVWHERLGVLLVVSDEGEVSRLDADGQNVMTWSVGGDLEGITVADPDSDLVYLGRENPDAIREFDLGTGALTGENWDLTPWMTGPDGRGLEALTYVEGLFYAGHQDEGSIYVFALSAGGGVTHLQTLPPPGGRDDTSGLHYDASTQTLYAIQDAHDVVVEMQADGTFVREFELPGASQEGIALVPDCDGAQASVFISQDSGAVWRYGAYPVSCLLPVIPALPGHGAAALAALLSATGVGLSIRRTRGSGGVRHR